MAVDEFDFQGVYHQRLKRLLEKRFPKSVFSVINAGVGGENATGGLRRLERDVIRHQPDLLLLAFCVNDAWAGLDGVASYRKNLGEIIRRVRGETNACILALTPNFMAEEDNSRVAPQHRHYVEKITGLQKDGTLKAYVEALKETAAEFKVALADVHAKWERLRSLGANTTDFLVNGLNHPDRKRQELAARTAMATIIAHYERHCGK